jgi:type IV pilus assembly protein PilN
MLKNLFSSFFINKEPAQQDILGIDISHSYVRIIQLVKKKKQWSLLKVASKSLDETYESYEKKQEAIVSLLKNIKLEQKFNTDNAAISLPVSSAIVQVLQIPFLGEEELNAAVSNGSLWENSINLPGESSEYSIFWQTIKKDPEKNTLSILFVASRIDEIEKNCDLIRKAGFEPLIVDVRCFALRNILKTYDESIAQKISAFVEISGEENYAVFIYDGLPFIYDIFVSDGDMKALINGGSEITKELFSRIGSQIRSSVSSFIKQSSAPGIEKLSLVSSLPYFDILLSGLKEEILEFKIESLQPFNQVYIPAQFKERIESEKNISSFTVSTGLATRQLDVFGYFKFVTAVSNINLLPGREDKIKKEKEKITVNKKISSLSIISIAILALSLLTYSYFMTTIPSDQDIAMLKAKSTLTDNDLSKIKAKYEEAKKWSDLIGGGNNKVFDVSFLQAIPAGVFIVDLNQKRTSISEVNLKTIDPTLANNVILEMGKIYKNVRLLGMESAGENDAFKTLKINYEMK